MTTIDSDTASRIEAIAAEVQGQRKMLAAAIRTYVKAQVDLWRRVPWLALQADGRTGYSDALKIAYRYGYWSLGDSGWGSKVDCATGELVHFHGFGSAPPTSLSDDACIAFADLKRIDAASIVAELEAKAAQKTSPRHDEADQEEWRAGIRKRFGVTETFIAPDPRIYPDYQYDV